MKLTKREVSDRVIQRLTEYLSILKEVKKTDEGINSIELAKIMNSTSAQVRKDLSTFGEFGVRGKGYDVEKLIETIEDILGINVANNVIIVGHGKMGEMLTSNSLVLGKGFHIVGVFDKDPAKVGKDIEKLNLKIEKLEDVRNYIRKYPGKVETAILAVTKDQAQFVVDYLISIGIKAFLNLTTYKLEVANEISVVNIDISAGLQELNFWRINPELKLPKTEV